MYLADNENSFFKALAVYDSQAGGRRLRWEKENSGGCTEGFFWQVERETETRG